MKRDRSKKFTSDLDIRHYKKGQEIQYALSYSKRLRRAIVARVDRKGNTLYLHTGGAVLLGQVGQDHWYLCIRPVPGSCWTHVGRMGCTQIWVHSSGRIALSSLDLPDNRSVVPHLNLFRRVAKALGYEVIE